MENYSKEEIAALYEELNSIKKVAIHLKVSGRKISAFMKENNIENKGNQGARKHHYNHDYFENIDSPEKAYWLGFIAADGCVYRGSDKYSSRLQINLKGSDYHVLEAFQKAIGSKYKITQKKVKTSDVCQIKINSTKMCQDLINLGVGYRKSMNVEYPKIDKGLNRHFIRGYFDGDGCISNKTKGYAFSILGGESMIAQIAQILFDEGIEVNVGIEKKIYSILRTSKISNIELIYKYFYEDAESFLDRKKNIFIELMNICPLQE